MIFLFAFLSSCFVVTLGIAGHGTFTLDVVEERISHLTWELNQYGQGYPSSRAQMLLGISPSCQNIFEGTFLFINNC